MSYKWRVFFIGAAIGSAGFISMFIIGTHNLGKAAEQFAQASVVSIFVGWDDKQLIDRASERSLRDNNLNALNNSFYELSKLGKLKRVYQIEGGPHYFISLTGKNSATATFFGNAEFVNGTINFQIDLIEAKTGWKIQALRIKSPAGNWREIWVQ